MNTNHIKAILAQYGAVKSQYSLLAAMTQADTAAAIALKQQLDILQSWLGLLTEEERFVVEKHIIGQLAWPYVMIEYNWRWGRRLARDERSLKRYQARALNKIMTCIDKHSLANEIAGLFDAICEARPDCLAL